MLELRAAGFRYARTGWVFRGADVTVPAGSVVAVLGPNGRGKTTLLRCAAGLLRLQEGAVRRDGHVGYVPQARGTTFAYRVLDMVLMGRVRQVGVFASPGRRDETAAFDALDRVGARSLAERPFAELSGGEQQLVLIARAAASGAGTLALDEPATGLDLHNQARILRLLRELADDGMAVLSSTHHPDHAMHIADSAVLMQGPDRVLAGPADELLTDTTLSDLYGVSVRILDHVDHGVRRKTVFTPYDV